MTCAAAWAQGEDEGGGDEPPVEAQGSGTRAEAAGSDDATNGRDDLNCEDFRFQEDAQDFFDRQGGLEGGDEDRLDEDPGDDDGDACEDLPSRDVQGGSSGGSDLDDDGTPSGGVDSGFGPKAPAPEVGAPPGTLIVGAGLGVFMLIGLGIVRLRRAV